MGVALSVDRADWTGHAPGMARKLRLQYAGAICRLTSRCDYRRGWRWGLGNPSIGAFMNAEKQNVDMLGADPFSGKTAPSQPPLSEHFFRSFYFAGAH